MKPIVYITMTLALAMGVGSAAHANPRVTVENNRSQSILVYVYNGDDPGCTTASKDVTVKAGAHETVGCVGGGAHRCKVKIQDKSNNKMICENAWDACDGEAIRIPGGESLVVGENACTLVE